MSIGRHPDISGNLSLTVPGAGSGGQTFGDVKEYADYGGRFSPLGEPPRPGGDGSDEGDLWSLVTLDSIGMDLDIAFYYNSHSRSNGPFGYRRTCSLNLYARGSGTPIASGPYAGQLPIVTLTRGDDSTTVYKYDEDSGSFLCQSLESLNRLYLYLTGPLAPVWAEMTPDGRWTSYAAKTDGSISRIILAQDAVENRHVFHYSPDGLLESVNDQASRFVTFSYDSRNLLHTVQDWANRVTTFTYDTQTQCNKPRLTKVTDAAGHDTQYQYDKHGRVTSIQDAGGYVTTYAYDGSGKVTGRTLVGANDQKADTVYDYAAYDVLESGTTFSYGQIAVTDALTARFTHTNDEQFHLVGWESPLGHVLTYNYNQYGQETERIDQHGGIWTTTYDENGLPYRLYDAKNRLTEFQYDEFANPISIKRPDLAPQQLIWGYPTSPFDTTGKKRRLQMAVDEVGNITTYTYTSEGLVQETIDALNHISVNEYDGLGNLTSTRDWLDKITQYGYDLASNVAWMKDADNKVFTYTYDTGDRQQSVLNPLNQLSTNLYDALGNLKSSIDFRGNRTTYLYNIFDASIHSLDATNRYTAADYDKVGQQIASMDGLGKITTTTYDEVRRPVESIDPMLRIYTTIYDQTSDQVDGTYRPAQDTIDEWGNRSTTVFDEIGRVIGDIDPLGNLTQTQYDGSIGTFTYSTTTDALLHRFTTYYDPAGRAVGTLDYQGGRTTTVYDQLNRVSEFTDALGRTTTTLYDLHDDADVLSTATIDAKGQRSTVTYDSLYRPVIQSDVAGNITQTAYDALSRVKSVTDPALKTTNYLYDQGNAANPADSMQDARGYVSTSIYDAAGRSVMSVDALGNITTTIYDAAGRPLQVIDPLGHSNQTVYDASGRVINTIDALGNATTTIYDQRYTLAPYIDYPSVGMQDERGNVTTQIYDAAGRQVATANPDGTLWQTQYDQINRPIVYLDPLGKATALTYDVLQDGNPAVRTLDALGQVSTVTYDLGGQQIGATDVLGNAEVYQYDKLGRQSAVRDARSQWTYYEYDDVHLINTVVDANGGRTTSVFDSRGLLSATYDPLNHPESYSYNDTGNLIKRTDRRGVETLYTPDALGRTHLVQYPGGKKVTYLFDAGYRRTNMQDWTGDTSYAYNNDNWLTGLNHSNDKDLIYTPDAAGNRRFLLDPSGGLTTYSYDKLNRLSTIHNAYGEVTTHTYDGDGRLSTRAFANGVLETRTYDDIGRNHTLKLAKASTNLAIYTTTYAKVAEPVSGQLRWQQAVAELDGSITTYLYDVDDQLVDANRTGSNAYRTTFAYDPLGNRRRQDHTVGAVHTTTTYAYDKANQLLSSTLDGALTTYSYDSNGNLSVLHETAGRTTFMWDAENRLSGVVYPSGDVATHLYTADGMRQSKASDAGVTGYVWDGQNVLEELDGSGAVQSQYTDYPGSWGGLVSKRSGDDSTFYGFDPSDNTRELLDGSGAVASTITYNPFGEQIDAGSGINTGTYVSAGGRFGYQNDSERLRYVRARYLDVVTGRWLSRDPLGFGGGDINLYRNVHNDPVNRVDPSGLWQKEEVHFAATKQWAREVYLRISSNNYAVFSENAAYEIASGTESLDDPVNSAAYQRNWHIHFNYLPSDDNRVKNGLALNKQPDTRITYFQQQKMIAYKMVLPNQTYSIIGAEGMNTPSGYLRAFRRGLFEFGRGLHAIEDIYAHGDLTPAEHQDKAYGRFVDDPSHVIVNKKIRSTRIFSPLDDEKYGPGGGIGLNYLYRPGPIKVRDFKWRFDPTFSRMNSTEAHVKSLLIDFLRHMVKTKSPHVSYVKSPPPQSPKIGHYVKIGTPGLSQKVGEFQSKIDDLFNIP